jgi:hypothetical protein
MVLDIIAVRFLISVLAGDEYDRAVPNLVPLLSRSFYSLQDSR